MRKPQTRKIFLMSCVLVYIYLLANNISVYENLAKCIEYYDSLVDHVNSPGMEINEKGAYDTISQLKSSRGKLKIILAMGRYSRQYIKHPYSCSGCLLTEDKSFTSTADALVFSCHLVRKSNIPFHLRSPWRYVWSCDEPPPVVRFSLQRSLTELNGVFNWTMTYRSDSTISNVFVMPIAPVNKTIHEMIAEKYSRILIVWMVSNCHPRHRMEYAKELAKYVPADYYGECFGKRHDNITTNYKFYLAFENSYCKEYITEKFWSQALSTFSVPIVMGASRSDYEKIAPPNSFIHTDDFKSPRELADYLLILDNNDTLYGEYLRWRSLVDNNGIDWKSDFSLNPKLKDPIYKQMIDEVTQNPNPLCRLCEKLKNEEPENKVEIVANLDQWFNGDGYISSSRIFPICSSADSGHAAAEFLPLATIGYSMIYFSFTGTLFYCLFCKSKNSYGKL